MEDRLSETPPSALDRFFAVFDVMNTDALWCEAVSDGAFDQAWEGLCGTLERWGEEGTLPRYCERMGDNLRESLTARQEQLLDNYLDVLGDMECVRRRLFYRKGVEDGQRQKE